MKRCVRLCSYAFSFIAFFIFGSHLLSLSTNFYRNDVISPIQTRKERHVLEFTEPKVNTMCSEAKDVYLLVIINSAPSHFYLRWTIRQTWGKMKEYKNMNIRLAFVLGQLEANDWRTKHFLEKENAVTNDLVFGDFYDTYYNLTTKTLYGMNWVRKYCNNAKYILKGDDDVLIIPQNIIDYLQNLPSEQSDLLYEGACQVDHGPIRANFSKWYISENDFPNNTYPPYQLGVAVLHSYKAMDQLYQACYDVPNKLSIPITFPFDDVFIGICAAITDVEPTCNHHIIVYKEKDLKLFLRSRKENCLLSTTLAVHGLNSRRTVNKHWNLVSRVHRDNLSDNCSFNYTTNTT